MAQNAKDVARELGGVDGSAWSVVERPQELSCSEWHTALSDLEELGKIHWCPMPDIYGTTNYALVQRRENES